MEEAAFAGGVIVFETLRRTIYAAVVVLSVVVLAIAGHFAGLFLPLHAGMVIFSLIVAIVTMIALLAVMPQYRPRLDIWVVVVIGILWLCLAAFQTNYIGHVDCAGAGRGRTPTGKGGSISSRQYCTELQVMQAFSWINFAVLALTVVITLVFVRGVNAPVATGSPSALGRRTFGLEKWPWSGRWGGAAMQSPVQPPTYGQVAYAYPSYPTQAYAGAYPQPYGHYQHGSYAYPGQHVVVHPQATGAPMYTTAAQGF